MMNKTFLEFNVKQKMVKDHARWLLQTLDITAEELHGEFGYDTCNQEEKLAVLAEMIENGDFDNLGKL
jgi:hypothetical protein